MQKTWKRWIALLLHALLLAGLLTGCTAPEEEETPVQEPATEAPAVESAAEPGPEAEVTEQATQRDVVHDADTQITFTQGQVQISGAGASAIDGVVTIMGGGRYTVSGAADEGAIVVDSPAETVELVLDGADVSGGTRPGIRILDAGSIRITLQSGTDNNVRGGNAQFPAALYSSVPLTIGGSGSLFVYANVMDGIYCQGDLTIEDGSVGASATGTAIAAANDEQTMLTIAGGSLYVSGDQCALKTSGFARLSGGSIMAFGGVYSSEGGIDAESGILLEGAVVCATGGPQAKPVQSGQPYLFYEFQQMPGASSVTITEGSQSFLNIEIPRDFTCLLYSGPALSANAEYEFKARGESIAISLPFTDESSSGAEAPQVEQAETPEEAETTTEVTAE